jgi:hypothetical protein
MNKRYIVVLLPVIFLILALTHNIIHIEGDTNILKVIPLLIIIIPGMICYLSLSLLSYPLLDWYKEMGWIDRGGFVPGWLPSDLGITITALLWTIIIALGLFVWDVYQKNNKKTN